MFLNNLIILQIVFVIRYDYVTSIISSNAVKLYSYFFLFIIKSLFLDILKT